MSKKAINILEVKGLVVIKKFLEEKYGELTQVQKTAISIIGSKLIQFAKPFNLTNAAEAIHKIVELTALNLQPNIHYYLIPYGGRNGGTSLNITMKWQTLRDWMFKHSDVVDIELHAVLNDYDLRIENGEVIFSYTTNLEQEYSYEDIKGAVAILHFANGRKKIVHLDKQELTRFRAQSPNQRSNSPYNVYPKAMAFAKLMKRVFETLKVDYIEGIKILDNLEELDFIKETKTVDIGLVGEEDKIEILEEAKNKNIRHQTVSENERDEPFEEREQSEGRARKGIGPKRTINNRFDTRVASGDNPIVRERVKQITAKRSIPSSQRYGNDGLVRQGNSIYSEETQRDNSPIGEGSQNSGRAVQIGTCKHCLLSNLEINKDKECRFCIDMGEF